MIFYAIQHTTTGNLLPPGGKGQGGHTRQEATSARPPRLFIKEQYAQRALSCYVKGRWKEFVTNDRNGECDVYTDVIPRTERKKDEFKIVKVELRVS